MFRGDHEFGDSFCYALPFKVVERFEEPELSGKVGLLEFIGVLAGDVQDAMTPCQYRALWEAASGAGFGVLSTRIKNGVPRTIELRQVYWAHREYEIRTGEPRRETWR